MSEFSNVKIGEAGMHLIELSASMSKPLVFTKCEIGDGISDGTTRTELISKKMTAPITRVAEVVNADVSEARNVLYFAYSNDGIAEGAGFSATEIGIYAKVSSDSYTDSGWGGYKGEETFYGYAYAVDAKHGEWIPDKTYKMDVQEFAIYTSVGNASSVGVEITSDVYAREEDFEYHLTDPEAHRDFKGCSDASSGVRGFVPAPKAGDGKKFLSATGGWERAGHSPLELYDLIYPVGIVVEFENSTDPNTVFPGTTWIMTQKGQVAVGAGDYWENGTKYTYALGDTGGEVKHPLSDDELPSHGHSASCSTNGNHYHGTYGDVYSNTNNSMGVYDSSSKHGGLNGFDWDNVLAKTTTDGNHSHTITIGATGGNVPHENRQPYKVVAKWLRTA